jgi:hypothetical protein
VRSPLRAKESEKEENMPETVTMTHGRARGPGIHLEITVTKDQAATLYYALQRSAKEFRDAADEKAAASEVGPDTVQAWRDNAKLLDGIASMFRGAAFPPKLRKVVGRRN